MKQNRVNLGHGRVGLTFVSAVVLIVGLALAVATRAQPGQDSQPPPPEPPQAAHLAPEQLQELVAPIALYPDPLVAQILAAAAYPTQIVEADRFLQANPGVAPAQMAAQIDQQEWDPSVKALAQFPSVLANLDKDLSWTSELGDAEINQPADVMDAVQFMRHKAQADDRLQSSSQQTVTNQGNTVVIEPANPEIVYVPDYDPTLIYGYPVGLWPGFYPWWGVTGPYISFGIGFGLGPFWGFGWGWNHWGFDWGHRGLFFHGAPYAFHSHAFYDHNAYFHGGFHGNAPYARGDRGMRGFGPDERGAGGRSLGRAPGPQMRSMGRAGAFGGISRGGDARSFGARGRSSMGGGFGGGFGGGRGGGFGGGGGRGGGGRR